MIVSDLHNQFFAEILDGIAALAVANGFRVLITTSNWDPGSEATALETFLELRTDGVILASPTLPAEEIRRAGRSVPIAIVTSPIRLAGVDTVATDDVRGAELAVEHLVGLGHTCIALIDGGAGAGGAAERRTGYQTAMRRLGLRNRIQIAPGDFTEEGGLPRCATAPRQ